MNAQKQKYKSVKVTTPIGRLSYPALFSPVDDYSKTKKEYRCELLFDEKADFTKFNDAIDEVLAHKFGPNKKTWPMADISLPLVDQENQIEYLTSKDKPIPDHLKAGNMMSKFKTGADKGAPLIIDINKHEIADSADVYGGCYGRVLCNLVVNSIPQTDPRTKKKLPDLHYVTAYLSAFQKVRDGDAFGGAKANVSDFDQIDDADLATDDLLG